MVDAGRKIDFTTEKVSCKKEGPGKNYWNLLDIAAGKEKYLFVLLQKTKIKSPVGSGGKKKRANK